MLIQADHKDTTEPKPCPHCKGEHWFGNYDHPDHCPVCGGSGLSPISWGPDHPSYDEMGQ